MPYHQLMDAVHAKTLEALIAAYDEGKESLLVIHGHSTSRPGKQTSRSVVRALMRGKEATPYIVRKKCFSTAPRFWHTSIKNRDVQQGAPIGIPSLVAQLTAISIRRSCPDAENRGHDRQQS